MEEYVCSECKPSRIVTDYPERCKYLKCSVHGKCLFYPNRLHEKVMDEECDLNGKVFL